jgi:hypothetical protein
LVDGVIQRGIRVTNPKKRKAEALRLGFNIVVEGYG